MSVVISSIPFVLALFPMIGALFIVGAAKYGDQWRSRMANAIAFVTFLIACWQFYLVQQGVVIAFALEGFMAFGLRWRVDYISAVFAIVVAAVWLFATVFAREYMAHEHNQTRFFAFSIFTLGATLGVFVAGDLFTLFLFFELMTFAAYLLVIHEQDRDSLRAGNVYLYMSIAGGLALLGVIFLLQFIVGTTEFQPALHLIIANGMNPWLILIALIAGFGVKAGMIPLHIWLPKAHPVAPAPASALLSAIMIKTGAYGFLRFLFVVLSVPDGDPLFVFQQDFGYLFVWIGAITMFVGAIMGILNNSMKKILAYSSISQMGYILFAVGSGVLLGSRGAFGFAGAWMHMINHAFFKSFLFLLAGAVFMQTGELNLNKLGGLRKQMPFAMGFFLIAAASITGIPGFNGYVSKIIIHEAILEAYHLLEWPSLLWLERIFVITGGLTAAYISKIWLKTFFGKARSDSSQVHDLSRSHVSVFAVYTIISVGIGAFAQQRVDQLVLPALTMFSFYQGDIAHLGHVPFWGSHELMSPIISYAIAGTVLVFLWKFGKQIAVPCWLSVEYLVYKPLYKGCVSAISSLVYLSERWLPSKISTGIKMWHRAEDVGRQTREQVKRWERPVNHLTRADLMRKIEASRVAGKDQLRVWRMKEGEIVKLVKQTGRDLHEKEKLFGRRIYEAILGKTRRKFNPYWSTKNLGFDTWIVAIVIALILFVFLIAR